MTNGERASLALKVFGGTQGVLGVLGVVVAIWRSRTEHLLDAAHGVDELEAVVVTLQKIARIWVYAHAAGLLLTLACVGVLVASMPKGAARAFALAGLVATTIYGGLFVYEWLQSSKSHGDDDWGRIVWIAADVAANLGVVMPIVGARRATHAKGGGLVGLVAALAAVESCVVAYANLAKHRSHAIYTITIGVDVALSLAIAFTAWFLARHVARPDDPARTSSPEGALDGGPMRTLGAAMLLRVGVGVVITIATVVCVSTKDYSTAGVALGLGAMGSIVASVVAVVGLVGYLRMPAERRSADAITFALVALALSAFGDVVSAFVANDLFSKLDDLTHATSIWSMPSISDMEEMQATLTWVGRGATVLGLVATLALASSLRKTARSLDEKKLDEIGNVVVFLVVAVGACAIASSIAVSGETSDAIYLIGPITLLLAIALLVQWVKLLFGLATALDRHVAPAPAPASAPAPEDTSTAERSPRE